MSKYITRAEIADKLGLPLPVVSKAIAEKVIPVDAVAGRVPATWFESSKITAGKVYEELNLRATKSATGWIIAFTILGGLTGYGIGLSV